MTNSAIYLLFRVICSTDFLQNSWIQCWLSWGFLVTSPECCHLPPHMCVRLQKKYRKPEEEMEFCMDQTVS